MAHGENSIQSFDVIAVHAEAVLQVPEVLATAPEAGVHAEHTATFSPELAVDAAQPAAETEIPEPRTEQNGRGLTVKRLAAGTLLAGGVMLGTAATAEAAPTTTTTVEAQSQAGESNNTWVVGAGLALTAATIVTTSLMTGISLRKQTQEKKEDRYAGVLKEIKGESSGQEQVMRLHTLSPYAENPEFAPKVFKTTVAYLKARRSELDKLREQFKEDSEGFEIGVREKRNAAREALSTFFLTLPAARDELRKQTRTTSIKRVFGRKDELEVLAELTDTYIADEKPRVDARAINLDYMRDIKKVSFRGADLTGAGLQGDQITNVSFRDTRLCEAQFEGSTMLKCDLREADLRAANFYGATFDGCVINKDTQFGNLPDKHPDAKVGSLDPEQPDQYRGEPHVVLKDLISDTLNDKEIMELVKNWQRNGLKLEEGSNPEYLLTPEEAAEHQNQ